MSDKRMTHVFNEMMVKAGRDVDTAELHFINGGVSATFFCAQQAHHAAHAINNHDRLVEENAQQRESLDAFRELIKAQTKTMNELNEKCKEQSKLIKELTYESGGKWYTGLHGDSDITDIVGDLLD